MAEEITFDDISLKLPNVRKLSVEEMFYKAGEKQGEGQEKGKSLSSAVPRRLPPIALQQTYGKTSSKRRVNVRQNNKQFISQAASRFNQTHSNSLPTELEPLHAIDYQPPPVITRRKTGNISGTQLVNAESSLPLVNRKETAHKEGKLEDETLVKSKIQNPPEFGRIGVTDTVKWAPQLLRRRVANSRYAVTSSDEEILGLEKQMGDLLVTTRADKNPDLFDFSGKLVASSSVYKESESDLHGIGPNNALSNYEDIFRRNRCQQKSHSNPSSAGSTQSEDQASELTREAKRQMQGRFYKALDVHVFNQYRENHQKRRMAICEEIEQNTSTNGISLSWFREHLRMQEILDSWVL